MRLFLCLLVIQNLFAAELRLVDSRKIWDGAPHNAFTDLIRHNGEFLCVFREADTHVSPGGKIRVISSKDGRDWTSRSLLSLPNLDLRDPKITPMPGGSLMLYAASADRPKTPVTHLSWSWFSKDGKTWTEPTRIGETNNWLWRIAWNGHVAHGVGYNTGGDHFTRLYKSIEGKKFDVVVPKLQTEEFPNEAGLAFDKDILFCLQRRDGKPGHGLIGIAKPPYTDWTWKDLGAKIGGPNLIILLNGKLLAGVRLYDGAARMSIVEIDRDSGKLKELVKLPSGGDCSYPGLVFEKNELFVSYYSSHEKKTMIYFARLKFE